MEMPQPFRNGSARCRNYGFAWANGPLCASAINCLPTYHGQEPNSEPEVRATVALMDDIKLRHTTVLGAIDWHSYSQLILRPYGWALSVRLAWPAPLPAHPSLFMPLGRCTAVCFSLCCRSLDRNSPRVVHGGSARIAQRPVFDR
jgi:hypothetical protein